MVLWRVYADWYVNIIWCINNNVWYIILWRVYADWYVNIVLYINNKHNIGY
jgi:hypothetical protein